MIKIETEILPEAINNEGFACTMQASGGRPPYSWKVSSGNLSQGLTLSSNGYLFGIPHKPEKIFFDIMASDSSTPMKSSKKSFNLTIKNKDISIETTSLPLGIVQQTYPATQLQASGGTSPYRWTVSSGNLPQGLTLSPNGYLSGILQKSEEIFFDIMVLDSSVPMQSTRKTFTVKIAKQGLTIETASLASGKVREAYSQTLQASGGTSPYVWSIISGKLPDGLSLSSSMGEISGTPTKSGESALTFKVTDNASSPQSKEKTLTLSVASSELVIETNSLPSGTAGQPYPSFTLKVSGGDIPYTFSCTGLPDGLRFSSSTGEISGTPTKSGESELTFKVTDSASSSQSTQKSLKLLVAPSNLVIDTSSLASGKVGEAYSQTLQASGGTSPYVWSISSGHLPVGIALSHEGRLSGILSANGEFTVEFQVSDQSHPQQTAKKTFTVKIDQKDLVIDTSSLASGKIGEAYSQILQASGGTSPYVWSIISGKLPDGLSLSSSMGEISGTSKQLGDFTLTFKVIDSSSSFQSAQKTLTLSVSVVSDLAILYQAIDYSINAAVRNPSYHFSVTLQASGGNKPYIWSISQGSKLPNGFLLSRDGIISVGGSGDITAGNYLPEFQVSDSSDNSIVVKKILPFTVDDYLP